MKAQAAITTPPILVIGYGNELRSDDGAGPIMARAVAAWGLRGVQTLALHQLVPEVAAQLARAEYALFIDAYAGGATQEMPYSPVLRPLRPGAADGPTTHTFEPSTLLALALALYGCAPRAWLVTVPTASFEHGMRLSPQAAHGTRVALRRLRSLLRRLARVKHGRLSMRRVRFHKRLLQKGNPS